MKLLTLPLFTSIILVAPLVWAQDFAIESLGFASVTGASTDGNFAITGTMIPSLNNVSSDGNFAISGQFQNVIGGPPTFGPELVVNGSFENTQGTFVRDAQGLMALNQGSTVIPGWTTTSAQLAWVDNTNVYSAVSPFGLYSLDLTGYLDNISIPQKYGGVKQTIQTVAGRNYLLSVALTAKAGGQKSVIVCADSAGQIMTFPPTNTIGNLWATYGFRFTAKSNLTTIAINGLLASGYFLGVDNVSVKEDTSVPPPEPRNLVVNGSFEMACAGGFAPVSGGLMSLQQSSTALAGWTITTAELGWTLNFNSLEPATPYGQLFLDLTGVHDSPPYGGIAQTLATVAGENYQVSFSLGVQQDSSLGRGPVTVLVTAGATSNSFTFNPSGDGSQWGTFTMDFTATSTSTPLSFVGTAAAGGSVLGLDNISVFAATSGLVLTSTTISNGELRFGFPASSGQNFVVEGRGDLTAGDWTNVPNAILIDNGATRQVVIPDAMVQPKQFYRVKLLP